MMKKYDDKRLSRRDFIGAAGCVAAFTIVPRHVLGGAGHTAASEKLNIAGVGVGGMGKSNLEMLAGENIVALCDVDEKYAAETFNLYPNAKKYTDFRQMLEKQKDIEAVVIFTPADKPAAPCGACRQVINEFNPEAQVYSYCKGQDILKYTLHDLLPHSFTSDAL